MRIGGRIRAWVTESPWLDRIEVRLVHDHGSSVHAATGVKDGRIVWAIIDPEGAQIEPFLYLGYGEVDALAEALNEKSKPVDATADALRDTREVRDRLLTLIEKRP